jgi:hypothetical protein
MTTCSFWDRQEYRDADDHGFGANPFSIMKPADAEAAFLAREVEDEQDPPCGKCDACIESVRDCAPELVDDVEETTPIPYERMAVVVSERRR